MISNRKKRKIFLFIAMMFAIILIVLGEVIEAIGGLTLIEVTFVSVVQTGGRSGTDDSTGLTLTFSADPITLTAEHITVTGATKGALSGTGTTRMLAISDIKVGNGEMISVSIASPSGYTISGSPRTAVVYKIQELQ